MRAAGLLIVACALACAKPPEIVKIVNAASQTNPYLAGDEIAAGSLLNVWGRNFESSSGKTTVAIAGTQLLVLRVTLDRIAARVPESIPSGRATLVVTAGNEQSRPIALIIVPSQFGLFSRIDEVLASGSRAANSVSNSAPPGSTVILSGTGLGRGVQPEVMVGGHLAKIVSIKRASMDGDAADEIGAVLPADAPQGCFVPVQVRGAGRMASNIITLAIRRGENWCDPPEYMPLTNGGVTTIGVMAAARTVFHLPQGPEIDYDEAGGFFSRLEMDQAKLNPFLLAPPAGSCTSRLEDARVDPTPPSSLVDLLAEHTGESLDGGPRVDINDGHIQRRIPALPARPGYFLAWFNDPGGRQSGGALGNFLAPAQLLLSGVGGNDIAPFRLLLPGPEPLEWTNRLSEIERAHGLDIKWKIAGANRVVMVLLEFHDSSTNTRGLLYCAAPAAGGEFRVPPEALASFPEVPPDSTTARATLFVVSWPSRPLTFDAKGAERAIGVSAFAESARVSLR